MSLNTRKRRRRRGVMGNCPHFIGLMMMARQRVAIIYTDDGAYPALHSQMDAHIHLYKYISPFFSTSITILIYIYEFLLLLFRDAGPIIMKEEPNWFETLAVRMPPSPPPPPLQEPSRKPIHHHATSVRALKRRTSSANSKLVSISTARWR